MNQLDTYVVTVLKDFRKSIAYKNAIEMGGELFDCVFSHFVSDKIMEMFLNDSHFEWIKIHYEDVRIVCYYAQTDISLGNRDDDIPNYFKYPSDFILFIIMEVAHKMLDSPQYVTKDLGVQIDSL